MDPSRIRLRAPVSGSTSHIQPVDALMTNIAPSKNASTAPGTEICLVMPVPVCSRKTDSLAGEIDWIDQVMLTL